MLTHIALFVFSLFVFLTIHSASGIILAHCAVGVAGDDLLHTLKNVGIAIEDQLLLGLGEF